MTDPIYMFLKNDLEVSKSGDDNEVLLVLSPLMKGDKGDPGERGDPPIVQNISASSSLSINYALGRSVNLELNGTISSFNVTNWPDVPAGIESALVLNIKNNGNHIIASWPPGSLSQGGVTPAIGVGAGKRSCVILRTTDRGTNIFVDVIANNYSPIP